jgi:hypothetical protein
MAKFMTIWRPNPAAQWPIDPTEMWQLNEMTFAAMDEALKSGQVLEFGWFPSNSGYAISSGEAKDVFMRTFANYPWFQCEVHEIIDYETGKEIARQVQKAKAEQMAAMKR